MSALPLRRASAAGHGGFAGPDGGLVGGELVFRVIELLLGDAALFHQPGVAVEGGLVGLHHGKLRGNLALGAQVVRLQRTQIDLGLRQIGPGVVQRDLEFVRVEAEQHLAGGNVLALVHRDLVDDPRDVGGNREHVGLQVGVVVDT